MAFIRVTVEFADEDPKTGKPIILSGSQNVGLADGFVCSRDTLRKMVWGAYQVAGGVRHPDDYP